MHEILSHDVMYYRHEVTGDVQQGLTLWAKGNYPNDMYEVDTAFAEREDAAMEKIAERVILRHKRGSSKISIDTDEAFDKWSRELAAELEASEEE